MTGILAELGRLSAAEEIFTLLDVAYDPQVLNVSRLHVLRRFRDYLGRTDLAGLGEAAIRDVLREKLAQAHADFTTSGPLDQRVFKVLKDAVAPRRRGFVPLSELSGS